jgi:hypothetical protein
MEPNYKAFLELMNNYPSKPYVPPIKAPQVPISTGPEIVSSTASTQKSVNSKNISTAIVLVLVVGALLLTSAYLNERIYDDEVKKSKM